MIQLSHNSVKLSISYDNFVSCCITYIINYVIIYAFKFLIRVQ